MAENVERLKILDIPIDVVDMQKAKVLFEKIIEKDGCDLIVTPNSEIVMNAQKDFELKGLIEKAALIIPDGIGLVYASKIIGRPLKERVTGIDFLTQALKHIAVTGQSAYILGSKPANEERASVAQLAAQAMQREIKGLNIAGTRDGYFKEADEAEIVRHINASGAEFLVVALGAPKQEKFIYKHKDEFTNIKAAIGVGGSLDVWAGTVKRAPEFYQKHGLEWLYRFIKEPSRFRRVLQLPLFMIKVIVRGKR